MAYVFTAYVVLLLGLGVLRAAARPRCPACCCSASASCVLLLGLCVLRAAARPWLWPILDMACRFQVRGVDFYTMHKHKQMLYYLFTKHRKPTSSTWDCPLFRSMFTFLDEHVKFLGCNHNREFAEYGLLHLKFMKLGAVEAKKLMFKLHRGNGFIQGQDDCTTIGLTGKKYIAIGEQFTLVGKEDVYNLHICTGFRRMADGSSAQQVKVVLEDVAAGWSCSELGGKQNAIDLWFHKIQDGNALAEASLMGFPEDLCLMHDDDKIGRAGAGLLVRTRNKVVVNPFPEGEELMRLAVTIGQAFHHEHREVLRSYCAKAGVLFLHWHGRLDATRMAGPHSCLLPLLQMAPAVMRCARDRVEYAAADAPTSAWVGMAELEAMFVKTTPFIYMAQHEAACTGGYRIVAKKKLALELAPDSVADVIDFRAPGNGPKPQRIRSRISSLGYIGVTAFQRAHDEALRRMGMVRGTAYTQLDWVGFAADVRTVALQDEWLNRHEIDLMNEQIESWYIDYYVTAAEFDHIAGVAPWWRSNASAAPSSSTAEEMSMSEFCMSEETADDAAPARRTAADFDHDAAKVSAKLEFDDKWPKWQRFAQCMDWRKTFKDAEVIKKIGPDETLDLFKHMLHVPILPLYKTLMDRQLYGMFPLIGLQVLGRDLAESFSEGVNKAGKDVVADRPSLGDDEIEVETILKKNASVKNAWEVEFKELYAQLATETEAVLNDALE